MTTKYEWESISDELFESCGVGKVFQVLRTDVYMEFMEAQNEKVIVILREKYPDREFRCSKWHSHDFGSYQEVEEKIAYEDEDEEEENVCSTCNGTREVSTDERDSDGNWQRGVGTEVCPDCIQEPADMSGASEGDR